jgi:hypothetical protein
LNKALTDQRALAKQKTYKLGATILLREALAIGEGSEPSKEPAKRCVTDHKETVAENVGRFRLEFPAGLRPTRFDN